MTWSTLYDRKTAAIAEMIQSTLDLDYYPTREAALEAASKGVRSRVGELQIDSAEFAAGIKLAVRENIITAAEAALI